MSFFCNGIITGYTAALRGQNKSQGPMIQVWREDSSQLGHYYKMSDDIAINNASCVGGLTDSEVFTDSGVFHCNLNQNTKEVSVEPGDILGLKLPSRDGNDILGLAFARVSGGSATNFVFSNSQGRPSPVVLSSYGHDYNWANQMILQITLEIDQVRALYS